MRIKLTPTDPLSGLSDAVVSQLPTAETMIEKSAVPGTKNKAGHALAPALVHRPKSQKTTGRATVLRRLSRRSVIFWAKNDPKS